MAKENIGIEEAVRLTLVERGDIPALELVALLEQRHGLKLDARFIPIIKASLRNKSQLEARRAAVKAAEVKATPGEADSDPST